MIYKSLCSSKSMLINIVLKVNFNASGMLLLSGNKCEMYVIINFTPFSLTVGTSVYTLAKTHQIIPPSLMTMTLCSIEPDIEFYVTSIGINVHSVTTWAAQTLAH